MTGFSSVDPFANKGPNQKPQSQIKEFGDLFALADQNIKVTSKKEKQEYGYNPIGATDAFAQNQPASQQPVADAWSMPQVQAPVVQEQKSDPWSAPQQQQLHEESAFAEPKK